MLSQKNEFTVQNQGEILAAYTPEITKLDSEITTLKDEITTKETEVNNLYELYIAEAEGTANSTCAILCSLTKDSKLSE